MKKYGLKSLLTIQAVLLIASFILISTPITASANSVQFTITGDTYTFNADTAYPFSNAPHSPDVGHGSLTVSGKNISQTTQNDIAAFSVEKTYTGENSCNLSLTYNFNPAYLNADKENWNLVEDSSKKIDTIVLDEKIGNGAVIVQTSKDGKIWVTAETHTNAFNGTSVFTYKTTDVQLVNGCYYRIIVAYELCKKVGPSKVLFWSIDKYEKEKRVEIYSLYASEKNAQKVDTHRETYELGDTARTAQFNGYFGSQEMIKGKDPHYGWKLGQFYLGGYTEVKNDNGNIVVLKNVGDQVVLWFDLFFNLDRLNNNPALTIEADPSGHDQAFQTPTQDFGKGALIIRKTDYNNHVNEPVVYKNYLEAAATVGAKTKVDLFEEGDYEVALDYAVRNDKMVVFGKSILPGESHYRISFKFSVRNANSMFYPRDITTQSELSNGDITPNGFFLDLVNSKYLQLNIVREVLKDGASGLTEDTRLNTVAKDGDSYTKDGVYTITVTNQYTGKSTSKKIYVGDNNILKAYMVTGLSISEIQDRLAAGATIALDGSIIDPPTVAEPDPSEITAESTRISPETSTSPSAESPTASNAPSEKAIAIQQETEHAQTLKHPVYITCIAIVLTALLAFIFKQNKHREEK